MSGNPHPDGHGELRRACQYCGARLRRGRADALCEPCSRRPGSSGPLLDAEFFTREPIRQALADYDFGYLFRAVRRAAGLTQQQLGDVLELDQDRISRIERGERQLRNIAIIARVATRLGIPPELLGFDPNPTTVEKTTTSEIEELGKVLRRDFSWLTAGTVLGLGVDVLDLDRLAALLPTTPATSTPAPPARIGASDVAAIEQATALFRDLDFSRGSGLCHSAAGAQLRSVLPLLKAAATTDVREQLLVATADLGLVTAWASYDAGHHDNARRLFMFALSVTQQAKHPRAADLTACLLMDMANQALHLDRPREALSMVQLGYGTAAHRSHPLSASTASCLANYQGWCQAAQGDAHACDRALGQAVEHFTHANPNTAAPWATYITASELAAQQGDAQYTLALTTADPKHAARAVSLLQEAVDGYGPTYARSRAITLPSLAGAYVLTGDLSTAVRTGHHAVQEITALASPRAYDRLRTLDTVLQPHAAEPAVSEVRGQIKAALVMA